MKKIFWVVGALLIPLMWMIPYLNDFFYVSASEFNDIAISHLPNAVYLLNSITHYHSIPLWSDTILSGYPFAANPLSGLFYLPGWLALLFPLPMGFNVMICLHLVWGGIGIFLWLQKEGYCFSAALVGALVFELMPKVFAHFTAGHITLVYAISWTGWLLFAECSRMKNQKNLFWIFPGIIWAMILLGDIRWGAYAGIIWFVYWIYLSLRKNFQPSEFPSKNRITELIARMIAWVKGWVLACGIGVALAGPLIIPLFEFIKYSTRQGMVPSENLAHSLPLGNLLGLFFSTTGGDAEWVLYPGIVVIGLICFGLWRSKHRGWNWFWIGVSVISIFLALGSNIPLITLIYSLPGFSLLRVPARALFILGLSFSGLGAEAIQNILERLETKQKTPAGLLVGLVGFVTILTAALLIMRIDIGITFLCTIIFAWLTMTAILLFQSGKLHDKVFLVSIISLIVLDLSIANISGVKIHPVREIMSEKSEVVSWLSEKEGVFRTYSPSYSLPQQSAIMAGIQLADGVDPMQISLYSEYMEQATGVPVTGYSVTIPPYANGDPSADNRKYTPDAQKLGILNVRYILAEYELPGSPDLELVYHIDSTWIYQNLAWKPRAWVQESESVSDREYKFINQLTMTPNRIEVDAEGPGVLVISEIVYPGWKVTVDGKEKTLLMIENLLRGVEIESGVHQVVFEFRPKSVYIGLAIGVVVLSGLVLICFFRFRSKK